MILTGRALKQKHLSLMHQHNVRPVERPPLPMLPPANGSQIVEGIAASADIDADRMSFARGSLTWPADLSKLPLLVRHDSARVAGCILDLDYDADGVLRIRARVDDHEACRMSAFSIAATVAESEVRDEASPSAFHFTIVKAVLTEVSITDRPANPCAIVTARRDVGGADSALAAAGRALKALEDLRRSWSQPAVPPPSIPLGNFPNGVSSLHDIAAATPLIYGDIPAAMLKRRRTDFGNLVCQMEARSSREYP